MSEEKRQQISDRFAVMRKQEDRFYRKSDYLSELDDIPSLLDQDGKTVDKDCRYKMATWCFEVVEYCKFSRDTANLAINYLDQFLGTKKGIFALYDRRDFQLAAMTSLELAAKIQEPKVLEMRLLSELSKGSYSILELTAMEKKILSALDWRMCPPTAFSFANLFLQLLPKSIPAYTKSILKDFSLLQIEFSVKDYFFVAHKSYNIALASILNAAEALHCFCLTTRQAYHRDIVLIAGIDPTDLSIHQVGERLKELMQLNSVKSNLYPKSNIFQRSSRKTYQDICPSSPVSASSIVQ